MEMNNKRWPAVDGRQADDITLLRYRRGKTLVLSATAPDTLDCLYVGYEASPLPGYHRPSVRVALAVQKLHKYTDGSTMYYIILMFTPFWSFRLSVMPDFLR